MTDTSDLAAAYSTVYQGDQAMMVAIRSLLIEAQAAIVAARPDPASTLSTPANQFVSRLLTTLGGTITMDLPGVLAAYGLQADGTPVVPPTATL